MRVLIVRTSALGDVIHALPVLTALRRHLPEAKIGWVVEEGMAPLLSGHPDLVQLLEPARPVAQRPHLDRPVDTEGSFDFSDRDHVRTEGSHT